MFLFVIFDGKKNRIGVWFSCNFFRLSCHWNVYCYLWCRWEKLLPMVSFFLPLVLLPLVQFSNQKQEFLPMVHSCLWCCNNYVGKSYFDIRNPILTFELSRKMLFWYSKSYFVIRTERDNRIFTFIILFWHSSWVGKS